jgi:hypothetical protein
LLRNRIYNTGYVSFLMTLSIAILLRVERFLGMTILVLTSNVSMTVLVL